jgi:hypothetical protein
MLIVLIHTAFYNIIQYNAIQYNDYLYDVLVGLITKSRSDSTTCGSTILRSTRTYSQISPYSKDSKNTTMQMKQSDWPVEPSTHCQFK